MNRARITYRFDQNGQPKRHRKPTPDNRNDIVPLHEGEFEVIQEEEEGRPNREPQRPGSKRDHGFDPNHDTQYLNQFTTDFGAWNSPFDAETEKLEQIIRDAGRPNAEPESGYVYDDRMSGTEQPGRFGGPDISEVTVPRYVRHTRPPWGKWMVSFSSAVVTGIVFGFLVLSLFSGETGPEERFADSPATTEDSTFPGPDETRVPDESGGSPGNGDGDSPNVPEDPDAGQAVGVLEVHLPARSYILLQNGVFSTEERADAAQQALKQKGFASAAMRQEDYYVYAGLLNNRDDALWLSRKLQQHDFETYIKTLEIPAVQTVRWNGGNAEDVRRYFEQGNELLRILADLSFDRLRQESASKIGESDMETVQNLHRQWNDTANRVIGGLTGSAKELLGKMNNDLGTAVLSMEAYNKSPSLSYQWQVQGALMSFAIRQKELIRQIEADSRIDVDSDRS